MRSVVTSEKDAAQAAMRTTLAAVAPGTELREGLERILRGRTGALIVLGHDRTVDSICTGGFALDVPFTATGLRELAKMDGAIIVDRDASRILRANVQLVPDPSIPTTESGTRHRTAERVAKQTGVPVVSVSQSMLMIALYLRDQRHVIEDTARILSRANQALATLERYKMRLDEVSRTLSALEIEDLVTVRDVCTVAQRLEMVGRIATEIDWDVVELGTDGRLIALQLDELIGGVDLEQDLVIRDYAPTQSGRTRARAAPRARGTRRRDLRGAARPRGGRPRARLRRRPASRSTRRSARAATACSPRCLDCPGRWSSGWLTISAGCRSCSPRPSTTSRPSTASARTAPAPSARACPAWPRRASSSATSDRDHVH